MGPCSKTACRIVRRPPSRPRVPHRESGSPRFAGTACGRFNYGILQCMAIALVSRLKLRSEDTAAIRAYLLTRRAALLAEKE